MSGIKLTGQDAERALNRLCREQMKHKLLADILADLMVCDIEGWDKLEYLNELQELINSFKGGEAQCLPYSNIK